MQSNRVLCIRKSHSWPKLGKCEVRRTFCIFDKESLANVQAEGADNLRKHEANGKPIKVKPAVPPKPKRKVKLVVRQNQEIVPPEIKNEAMMIAKQEKPLVFVKLEVKPEAMPQTKPEDILQIRPEVKSVFKPEVKGVSVRKSEPGQGPLDYPRVIPPAKTAFYPEVKPEVKSQTKPDVIPSTKSRVILHAKTRVIKQTSAVVISMPGNRVEGKAKPTRKVVVRFQATLQVRRQTATITTTESKPKQVTEPEIIRQTGGAKVQAAQPGVESNHDMKFNPRHLPKSIPFCETKVKMQSQGLAISKADNKPRPATLPEFVRQTGEANIPRPEVEPNPQAIPGLIPPGKPEVIFKPENKSEQGAEQIQWTDLVKAETKIKSEDKLKQEVIFKPEPIPDVLSLGKPKVLIQYKEVISKLENIFKQRTDIPRAENNTKLEAKLNEEVSFTPRLVPDVLSLRKPEVIMQSKVDISKPENTLVLKAEPSQVLKAENKIELEAKLNEVFFKPRLVPDVLSLTKPEDILQSREVVISNKEKLKLIAEPSQETDIQKAENKFNLEAKLNEEVFFKSRFIPDVLPLTKPGVIMQSKEVVFSNPENKFKLNAELSRKTDILRAEDNINLETKLNEEVFFKLRFTPDVFSHTKTEDVMQPKEAVIPKNKNKVKLRAEPSQFTDILKPENKTKTEAELNQEVIFKPRLIPHLLSLTKPEVITQSKEVFIPKPKNLFKLIDEPTRRTDFVKADNKLKLEAKLNEEVIFKPRLIPEDLSLRKPEVIMQSKGNISKPQNAFKRKAEPSEMTDFLKPEYKTKSEAQFNLEVILKRQTIPDVLSLRKPDVIMQSKEVVFSNPENISKLNAELRRKTDILRAENNIKLEAKLNEGVFFKPRFTPDVFSHTKTQDLMQPKEVGISKNKNKVKLMAEPSQVSDILSPENKTKTEAELNQEVIFKPRLIPHLLSLTKPEVIAQCKEVFIPKPKNPFKLIDEPTRRTDFVKADNKIKLNANSCEEVILKPRLVPEDLSLRKPEVIMQSKENISKPQNAFKRKAEPSHVTDFFKPEYKTKLEAQLNLEVILKRQTMPDVLSLNKPEVIIQSQEVAISNTVIKPNQEGQQNWEISEVWDIFKATGRINPEDEAKLRTHLDSYDYPDLANIDLTPEETDEFILYCKARRYLYHRNTEKMFRELEGMRRTMAAVNEGHRQVEEELDKWFRDKARWARDLRLYK
ncbi:titin-like [Drosophila subpulchrella]|uniref:titin-like n=1 Tax=Drosophila subpulchrella TaxID=1486046 RepID=UPI0018A1670F|nr:titin-like [Drosophila subpulchrella]